MEERLDQAVPEGAPIFIQIQVNSLLQFFHYLYPQGRNKEEAVSHELSESHVETSLGIANPLGSHQLGAAPVGRVRPQASEVPATITDSCGPGSSGPAQWGCGCQNSPTRGQASAHAQGSNPAPRRLQESCVFCQRPRNCNRVKSARPGHTWTHLDINKVLQLTLRESLQSPLQASLAAGAVGTKVRTQSHSPNEGHLCPMGVYSQHPETRQAGGLPGGWNSHPQPAGPKPATKHQLSKEAAGHVHDGEMSCLGVWKPNEDFTARDDDVERSLSVCRLSAVRTRPPALVAFWRWPPSAALAKFSTVTQTRAAVALCDCSAHCRPPWHS
ncbi:hypothetical protein H1C71_032856 [Ictidomys tridecemlineatus]|nr:hypothetical protein H1C71_032856 [Ictidomys tridecemlineatus]